MRFKDPKKTFSAVYIIRGTGFPAKPALQQEFENSLKANMAATTERLDKAGFDGKVTKENDSTYKVSAQNITDTISIRDLVSINSSLSFNEVYTISEMSNAIVSLGQEWPRFSNDTANAFFGKVFMPAQPFDNGNGLPISHPYMGFVEKEYADAVLKMLSDSAVARKFPHDIQFAFGDLDYKVSMSSTHQFLYALKKNTDPISNKNISKAYPDLRDDRNLYIAMQFDAAGARRWKKMTERNIGRSIAISINGKVLMAPQVLQAIEGGDCRISASDEENCRVVSVLLMSNELKLPVRIIQSEVKEEGKLSPKVLNRYINYILLFIISFAVSFCVIWFVFKPGKKLSRNA